MTWFKVDDRLHAHPKALATSLAALGLWTVAGSWSSDHLTDGFMPDHVVPLLSRGASELADELVDAGLWRRVRGGYRFHQWHENGDGSRRNPTKKEVEQERRKKADAGRKGGLASGKTRSRKQAPRQADAEAHASPLVEPPTRPDLPTSRGVTVEPPERGQPPPRTCQQHRNDPDPPPCGPCADARRAQVAWLRQHTNGANPSPLDDTQRVARAEAERLARVARGEECQDCGGKGIRLDHDGLAVPCHHGLPPDEKNP